MTTAEKIRKFRLSLCLDRKEFAEGIGISHSSAIFYEKGTREPSFVTIRKIIAFAKKKGIKLSLEDIRDNL